MLTSDLVRVRRRGDELQLVALSKAARARSRDLAATYLALTAAHIGQTRGELDESLTAVAVHARDRKIAAGLRKLIADRCTYEVEAGIDPCELRRLVFTRASAARRALQPGQRFEPAAVVAEIAGERGVAPDELLRQLYIDLRAAHRLLSFDRLSQDSLLELYELSQAQAVLLRAVRVVARVQCATPGVYRALFHRLKFLRLLHTIAPSPGDEDDSDDDDGDDSDSDDNSVSGYEITIDGPYSMFRSVTKYGLQLAMLLPALRACDRWSLDAEVLWGKDRKRLQFSTSGADDRPVVGAGAGSGSAADAGADAGSAADAGSGAGAGAGAGSSNELAAPKPHLRDEVATLLGRLDRRFAAGKTRWRAQPSSAILDMPGVGVCVPDVIFEHQDSGLCIYFEVMGFWSRDAVWKRIELVERGLPQQILFAVSSRLRVSEAALDSDLPGALYVYKGALDPGAVERRLDEMAAAGAPPE